jgi:dimethylargininase
MSLIALTREVDNSIGSCELTFLPRVEIDTELASQQHQTYQALLSSLGCEIVIVPAEPGLPDSVFIEDTAIVLDEIAVLCRPGTATRLLEVTGIEGALQQYRTIASIQPPGTLEGGDLLRVGKIIYAGLSTRSNQDGIEQLRDIVADYGYTVKAVETAKCLHLKSAVSEVAPGSLLINSDWVSRSAFGDCELIDIDKEEAHAANALLVGQNVIYPSSFPRTMERLVTRGIDVSPVDVSELQKAEGAVTCCSMIFTAP